LIVNKLIRIGPQAEFTAERPVEGENQKDSHANEGGEQANLDSL